MISKKTLDLDATPVSFFFIFHWNGNSVCAHNFIKLSLLRAYIAINQCDILCLSKTFLDSFILSDDVNLDTQGYNLVRANLVSNRY